VGGHAARLEVARIAKPHGLRGEVVVVPITNRPERFAPGVLLFDGDRPLRIATVRPHQQRWLVRFEGVDDRTGADALRGVVLTAEALGPAPEGELWVHEAVGASVTDTHGVAHGTVVAVEANPAHDLLVLDDGTLVPIVFVVEHRPGVVIVDPPEGLFDLARGS
jgi:16S rRNA processing protein RimM